MMSAGITLLLFVLLAFGMPVAFALVVLVAFPSIILWLPAQMAP